MAELFYTIDIDDKELDKKLKYITGKLQKSSTEWQDMLKPLQMPSFSLTGGGTSSLPKIKPEIVGLKSELADLEKQWGILTIAQRQALEGKNIIKQYADLKKQAGELSGTLNQLAKAQEKAAQGGSNFNKSIKDIGTQTQKTGLFASELVNTLKTFAGFYFARDAVKQLIEVSGQFELQLVSLRAITQSLEGANKLFSQFQTLSVKSPFQFSEILAGAKQLAAFQIPLKDLYQTTKVITDLSAGLGVDMGRIILAYGQIQAASVLRGQEVRQLTEAGIPVIQLLADKFSLLEERVVSTNEVFDKISNRMVPFEMIKEIFTDLTSEGGAFFNMQEKQADTLYGKVSNLKDAYQIMLNEIGTANNELLKGAVEIPMTLMENWDKVGAALTTLIATYGTYKGILLATIAIQKTSAAVTFVTEYMAMGKALGFATANMIAFNKASLANPLAILASVLVAVGSAAYFAYQNTQKLNNELSKISQEGLSAVNATASKFDELYDKLKQAKEGSQEFRDAIKAINNQYGEYLPNLLTESNALSELAGNYDKVTQAIYNKAKAQSAEKGFAAIQEEYGKVQEDAVSRLMDSLVSSGIPKDKAKDLLKLFRTELEKQTGEYNPYDLFNKVYEGYFDTTKEYFSDTKVLFKDMTQTGGEAITNLGDVITGKVGFKNLVADVYKLSDATKDVKEKTSAFGEQLDLTYSKSTAKTAEEADRIKEINDQYAKLNKIFYENSQSQEEWNETVKKLDYSKLAATVRMYEELKRPEMVQELKKQLAALGDVQDGWRGIVTEALKANKAGSIYKPQKDESQFDYIDRLKKAYKEVSDQIKTMASLSIFSPDEKARVEQQKSALESVAAVMGTSLLTDKTANKERKTAADLLKEESDLIKKVYADYEKLRKSMGDTAAQEEIKRIYAGLMQPEAIPFDAATYKKQLTDIAAKLQKLDTKAAVDIKLDVSDKNIQELEKKIKDGLDKASRQLEQYRTKYNLFEQLLGITGNEDMSITLSFGIEGIGTGLVDQIKQQFDAISGMEFDFIMELPKDQFDTLPDNIKDAFNKAFDEIQKLDFTKLVDMSKLVSSYADADTKIKTINANTEKDIQDARESTYRLYKKNVDGEVDITDESYTYRKKLLDDYVESRRKKGQEEINAVNEVVFQSTELYKKLFGDLSTQSLKSLKKLLSDSEDFQSKFKPEKIGDKNFMTAMIDGQQLKLTEEQWNKLSKAIAKLSADIKKDNPFAELFNPSGESIDQKAASVAQAIGTIDGLINNTLSDIQSMFSDMNSETGDKLAQTVGDIMGGLEGITKAGQGVAKIMAGDITGVFDVISGVAKFIGTIFSATARRNERLIKNSEAEIKRLENAYDDLGKAVEKAWGQVKYDDIRKQQQNLQKQNEELQKQLSTTGEKGGLSNEEAEEIQRQIKENTDTIKDLVDQAFSDIGIDVKSITDQLSDAMFDAFANGTDAAEAWGNAVDDIINDIVKNMITQLFLYDRIKPLVEKLKKDATDSTGALNLDKLSSLLPTFKEDMTSIGDDWVKFMEEAKKYGFEFGEVLDEEEKGKGTAQAITGVTEDTANILGGYMNGMRAEMIIHTGIFSSIYTLLQQRLIVTDNPIIQLQLNVMNQQLIELQTIKTILNGTLGAAFDAANMRFRVG